MNKLVNAVSAKAEFNGVKTYTQNGATARTTTGNPILDLFAILGSIREKDEDEIQKKYAVSWNFDPNLAIKLPFYCRNIRGGLGERKTAKVMLKWLAINHPEVMIKNLPNISKFGRYDDYFCLIDTPVENAMWDYLRAVIYKDIKDMEDGKPISLAAKWMKSINTSSEESVKIAKKTAIKFGLTPAEYRKMLSAMREYIDVVERKMSKNEWYKIDYSKLPAKAMLKYRKAFDKHSSDRLKEFLRKVESGEEEIKADTLYPYDLVGKYLKGYTSPRSEDSVVEAQWKALPNYISGENNVLVMADISGSMMCCNGRPMQTSVGLAIYFAERNKGDFEGLYMTFSSRPSFLKVNKNLSLLKNVNAVKCNGMGYSTNLEAAFMLVLDTCVKNNVPQKDVPKAIVVVSDNEIDCYKSGRDLDFVTEMMTRFRDAGYDMPKLIFWNVESHGNVYHANMKNPYVQFYSGQSVSTFKSVLSFIETDAVTAMINTLNDPMYDSVVI